MGTFASYNTDDPTSGATPLGAGGVATIGPIQTGVAHRIAGSCFSDTAGSLSIQQSFDSGDHGGVHWDIVDTIAVVGGTGVKLDLDVIAPNLQVVFTNGGAVQAHLRVFVRVFGVSRG